MRIVRSSQSRIESCAIVGIGQTKYESTRGDVSIAGLVREAAARALDDAGVPHRGTVAVVLPNVPEFLAIVRACSWSGRTVVPISWHLAAGDVAYVVEDSEADALVVHADFGALAAEQLGGSQRVLEMATDYAKTRLQFGRPIGTFGPVKHHCADMLVATEQATAGAWGAARADLDEGEAELAAAVAASVSLPGLAFCARQNIQVHGGIGFTWEHPAHLYFKRAKSSELLFGDPTYHRELLAPPPLSLHDVHYDDGAMTYRHRPTLMPQGGLSAYLCQGAEITHIIICIHTANLPTA